MIDPEGRIYNEEERKERKEKKQKQKKGQGKQRREDKGPSRHDAGEQDAAAANDDGVVEDFEDEILAVAADIEQCIRLERNANRKRQSRNQRKKTRKQKSTT